MAVSNINSRIKSVRKALGISQRNFCKGVFLSQSFYAQIETDRRKPNERIFELISSKYNVNKEWLITGKGEMFSQPPPDVELIQLIDIIKELDPLFREYIIQQIKLFAGLHKNNKEQAKEK